MIKTLLISSLHIIAGFDTPFATNAQVYLTSGVG
jgi:hypothetical protein